jgi:membrane protein involved in D-alanine export
MLLLKVHFKIHWIGFAGMSYITFRTIQILLDTQPTEKKISPRDYLLFLTFTPTLLIGPIDRSQRFIKNLQEGYKNLNATLFFEGWQNVALGILQKYVLAELVTRFWLQPEDNVHGLLQHINAAFAYTAYLYFDFAGYSSLAVGFGNMLGIKVPHNFNQPYMAINPQDFWRRWHITLGDWLRDYFFRPIYKWLSGFKSLKNYTLAKQNVSLFLTFVLIGCWNGFEHNYIWSGVIFGLYSVLHNTYNVECKKKGRDILFEKWNATVLKYFSIIIMIFAAVFAIYVFSGRPGI